MTQKIDELTCCDWTRSIAVAVSGWLLLLPLGKDAVSKSELRFPEIAGVLLEPLVKDSTATGWAEAKCLSNVNSVGWIDAFVTLPPKFFVIPAPFVKIRDPLWVTRPEALE